MVHAFHHVAEQIRENIKQIVHFRISRVISCIKKIFLKAQMRVIEFISKCILTFSIPPEPVFTQWVNWIYGVFKEKLEYNTE